MGLSKRTRFEIFKRDGFTCQYCGKIPPGIVLEVDHIHPRSKGGTDDSINLTTSCADCNRGKSDRVLGSIHPRPDADAKYLETMQEIAEAKRYLKANKSLSKLRKEIIQSLEEYWELNVTSDFCPPVTQWNIWLSYASAEELQYAIMRGGVKYNKPHDGFGGGNNYVWILSQVVRYISAVLRNVKEEKSGKEV